MPFRDGCLNVGGAQGFGSKKDAEVIVGIQESEVNDGEDAGSVLVFIRSPVVEPADESAEQRWEEPPGEWKYTASHHLTTSAKRRRWSMTSRSRPQTGDAIITKKSWCWPGVWRGSSLYVLMSENMRLNSPMALPISWHMAGPVRPHSGKVYGSCQIWNRADATM